MSDYRLIYDDGGVEREYLLQKDCVDIGRLETNDLILNDFGISRKHVSIIRKGKKYIVQDKGSRNGTLVNNLKIHETDLKPGDIISLGRVNIRFEGPTDQNSPILVDDGRKFDESVDHTIIKPMKEGLDKEIGTTPLKEIQAGVGTHKLMVSLADHVSQEKMAAISADPTTVADDVLAISMGDSKAQSSAAGPAWVNELNPLHLS